MVPGGGTQGARLGQEAVEGSVVGPLFGSQAGVDECGVISALVADRHVAAIDIYSLDRPQGAVVRPRLLRDPECEGGARDWTCTDATHDRLGFVILPIKLR